MDRGGGVVWRRQLFARLSALGPRGVALVTGPAGSGKTVLLRSWIEAERPATRVAWVSVDRGERDEQRFLLSLMDQLAAVAGESLVERISPTPGFRGETVVERLASELGSLDEPLLLVIDDLHELDSPDALRWLELLLTRLPSQLRVALATREEPPLALHRLRLTGGLTELRAADLRFSAEETRQLLDAAGIALSETGVALLHERTEGWAAGLRLATISLAEHHDAERFVTEFSGSERTVAGYLLAEVVERQPPEVRELLLRTSVLQRVSGPLADFLTGTSGSERILQKLEGANAFVSSVDVGRSWFRYHPLFAELLQLELRRVSPAMVESLHGSAARWYEEHGLVVEAIQHWQAAREWAQAASLLADHHLGLALDGRAATLGALMDAFPADAPLADPELALVFAAARAFEGLVEESAAYLAAAQRLAATVPRDRKQRFDTLMASARLWQASLRRDLPAALEATGSLEAALETEPAFGGDLRATALMHLGVSELSWLQVDAARRHLEQGLELARRIRRPWLEIGFLAHLAGAAPLSGLPASHSLGLARDAIAIAEAHGWQEQPVAAAAFAVGGDALTWLGRFTEAERWLERAEHAQVPEGEPGADPGTELLARYTRGLLRLGQGRLDEALEALKTAERMQTLLAKEHPLTIAVRGRILQTQVLMGETAAADAALGKLGDRDRDQAAIRIATAALHLAVERPELAIDALAPVIEGDAPAVRPLIEALVFEAAAHGQLGDARAARESLERALDLAEPDGIVLPFTVAPVRNVLERHPRHLTAHSTLLSTILDLLAGSSPGLPSDPRPLLDGLSNAELRVVRYLPSNLKAPEIASELFVSANTVRTHLRHIYAKLGAHSRSQAVARARELRLLAPSAGLV